MAIKVNSSKNLVSAIKVRADGQTRNVSIGRVRVDGTTRIFWPDGDLEIVNSPVITNPNSPNAALTSSSTGGIGTTLTVSNGTWSVGSNIVTPTSFVYQWKRGVTNVGSNINTYTPSILDRGSTITCTVTATYQGKTATANSFNSVLVASLPGTPAAPTLTRGIRQITVNWGTVASGGLPLTSYNVRWRQAGTTPYSSIFINSGTSNFTNREYTITGLLDNTSYEVQVAAVNDEGQGNYSNTSTASTFGVPVNISSPSISPTSFTAGVTTLTANRGSWSTDGLVPITQYRYLWAYSSTSSFSSSTIFADHTRTPDQSSTVTTPNLPGYYIRLTVVATNSVGDSSPANSIVYGPIEVPPPSTPTNFNATGGCNTLTCTWGASTNASGYEILYGTNATNIDNNIGTTAIFGGGSTTNGTITNVTTGSYYLKIRAYNVNNVYSSYSLRIGPISVSSSPGTPTINTPTVGCSQINVTWNEPSNNGSPITRYTLRRIGSDGSEFIENISSGTQFTNRSVTQTGLSANFTYRYQVLARNVCGDGSYSSLTTSVRPLTVPTRGSVRPVLSGAFKCGTTASSPNGDWTNATTYRYEWQYNPGSGFNTAQINTVTAITNNYNIPSTISPLTTLVGSNLRTQVTGQNACGPAIESYTSDPTGGVVIRAGDIGVLTRGPAENSGSLRRYTFTWGTSSGATRYYYELRRGGVPEFATTTTATSWTSPYLSTGLNWTFRVKGINGAISTGNNASDGDLIIIDGCLSGCLYPRW